MREFPILVEAVIESEFHNESFGVGRLAELSGLSVSYLRELTFYHRGCSPAELIERKRLSHARHLLEERCLRIRDVFRQAGYSNVRTFRSAFRRHFGVCPSECRESRNPAGEGAPGDSPSDSSAQVRGRKPPAISSGDFFRR